MVVSVSDQVIIHNVALSILTHLQYDDNKLRLAMHVVRERLDKCPLFHSCLDLKNIDELKKKFNDFVDDCLRLVLDQIE